MTERESGLADLKELHTYHAQWLEAQERRLKAWEEDLERREQILAKVKQETAEMLFAAAQR